LTWSAIEDARKHLSREQGTITKDWGGKIPIALIYPNKYFLGMSNLGIHTIYNLLNQQTNIVCERVFWEPNVKDAEPPVSIESQRSLAEFAVLAFSITYELDYFNLPRILEAAGIPPLASDRDETYPLIIAGGACITANPMPVAPFFDAMGVGEAEVIFPNIFKILNQLTEKERKDQIEMLSQIPGIYTPQATQMKVKRQWVTNLDDHPTHTVITTPDTELRDLYLIEVERGCRWGCRFCLVYGTFRPMRLHSLDSLVEQAKIGLKSRKKLGLVGPDVADHPQFEVLLNQLKGLDAEISVSSLRIKPLCPLAIEELARGGTGTVAFAPEAGSERLRRIIRKGINEDDILQAIEVTSSYRMKQLRLYFMIGLPTENGEDIEAIVTLSEKCKAIIEKRQSAVRLTLSVSPFVPKAGTPFQWMPMEDLTVLDKRLAYLKNQLRSSGIKVVGESPAWSEVQAGLARGDQRMAEVLISTNNISLASWKTALENAGLDAGFIHEIWGANQPLPWEKIDPGIDLEYIGLEQVHKLAVQVNPESDIK
jgi:radical SAM superfamily enzyme YgiQ (UPF0313 family)